MNIAGLIVTCLLNLQRNYHQDFESSKGKGFTSVSDTPEMLRIRKQQTYGDVSSSWNHELQGVKLLCNTGQFKLLPTLSISLGSLSRTPQFSETPKCNAAWMEQFYYKNITL